MEPISACRTRRLEASLNTKPTCCPVTSPSSQERNEKVHFNPQSDIMTPIWCGWSHVEETSFLVMAPSRARLWPPHERDRKDLGSHVENRGESRFEDRSYSFTDHWQEANIGHWSNSDITLLNNPRENDSGLRVTSWK